MLTPQQERWINSLSNVKNIKILPFDTESDKKFDRVKEQIQFVLGTETKVVHKGATSLGISGQGELDIYVPVSPEKFDVMVTNLEKIFGKPGSLYPLERARFVHSVDETKVEVFVINEQGEGWLDSEKFEGYLRSHPKALEEYKILKEAGHGLTVREYYRRKIEFINNILSKAV
ncbi:MAG: GrpB family protein [bacterium]|nr:GrpB family protein [bacterium]